MDRNRIVIGFVGIDKYEYIIYLSRILYHLNKRVLLLDNSDSGALTGCIPTPIELKDKRIEYRGVMFQNIRNPVERNYSEEDQGYDGYDCILIDYGNEAKVFDNLRPDFLVYVTDQQVHNLNHLAEQKIMDVTGKILIIKNYINHKTTPSFIMEQLNLCEENLRSTYVVSPDELDEKNKLSCQTDYEVKLKKLSVQTKNLVRGITMELYPDISMKELNKGWKKAERGG